MQFNYPDVGIIFHFDPIFLARVGGDKGMDF